MKQYVYFARRIDGTGPVKIGCSAMPRWRIVDLARKAGGKLELLATVEGEFPDEGHVHRLFESARQSGEWFTPTDDLLAFVEEIRATGKLPFRHDESRDAAICRRRLAGETLQSIANDYGITRERVRQIARDTTYRHNRAAAA